MATTPVSTTSHTPQKAALEFARLVGRLKTTPRTGWVRHGVPSYESVADHSWRVAILALLLQGGSLDVGRCMCMGLVHDVAEALIGDITPYDSISKSEKMELEHNAVKHIAGILHEATTNSASHPPESARHGLIDLLSEYEVRNSNESKVVKELDLLDMVIQADEYERVFGVDLTDFFEHTPVERFNDEIVKGVYEELSRQRADRIQVNSTEGILRSSSIQLSKLDNAFVDEYTKASTLKRQDVEAIITALRHWERKSHA